VRKLRLTKNLYNVELFQQYQLTRDIETRNKIVKTNLRFVTQVANYYRTRCKESFEDLFQIGTIGLIKAVENYNPDLKIKFTPFALPKIRGEILHWLRDKGHLIRIPPKTQELHQKIKKYSLQNKISYRKAALELGISKEQAVELNNIYIQKFKPIVEDIEEKLYEEPSKICIYEVLSILTEEERHVISCRILQEMTIKDTAIVLQLKPATVKKLEKQAIIHLQHEYCNKNA
jgi:RNA polymerase sigma-B factor